MFSYMTSMNQSNFSAPLTATMSSEATGNASSFDAGMTSSAFVGESGDNETRFQSSSEHIETFIYSTLIPTVCAFGIAGNILNLLILSRKSLTYTMERMEKSAHCGLLALAVSDLLFCVVALPNSIYSASKVGGFLHESFDFRLIYKLYGSAVVNTFVLTSTWLTVTMAASRYLAICHPLRARLFIGKRFAIISLVSVFFVCLLFNVPRFLRDIPREFVEQPCSHHNRSSGAVCYFLFRGPLQWDTSLERAYYWTYFVLGIVVPLVVLIYCNARLSIALQRSLRMRRLNSISMASGYQTVAYRNSHASVSATACQIMSLNGIAAASAAIANGSLYGKGSSRKVSVRRGRSERAAFRLTLTLIIIVVMYVTLFIPAELFSFFTDHVIHSSSRQERSAIYNTAMAIGNLLQSINFAINFILYCAVNSHFRSTICRLTRCDLVTTSIASAAKRSNSTQDADDVGKDEACDATGNRTSMTTTVKRLSMSYAHASNARGNGHRSGSLASASAKTRRPRYKSDFV